MSLKWCLVRIYLAKQFHDSVQNALFLVNYSLNPLIDSIGASRMTPTPRYPMYTRKENYS